jgi:O-antigen/teichoic acid export membrane protein
MIGGFLTAILFGGAVPIIDFVFGPGWSETQLIFSYLVIAMVGATAMNTTGWIYVSRGRTDRMLRWGLVSVPVYVGSFVIGLPYGAEGVALAYAFAQLLAFLPCFWMATRFTNLRMADIFNAVAPSLVITLIVGVLLRLAVSAAPNFLLDVVAIAVGCLLFFGLCLLAIRTWPPYRRVYDRARRVALGAIARVGMGGKNQAA